jgi:predicted Zn-dependent protease
MSQAALVLSCVLMIAGVADADLRELAQQAKQAMLTHRYSEAISLYQQMIAAMPDEPALHFNLALALHSSERYQEAVQELERIQASQQQNPKFWYLLGADYLKLSEPSKAIEPLRRAEDLDPSSQQHEMLARIYLQAGDRARAIAELRESVRLDPTNPLLQGQLARELLADRQYEEAITILGRLLRLNPGQP